MTLETGCSGSTDLTLLPVGDGDCIGAESCDEKDSLAKSENNTWEGSKDERERYGIFNTVSLMLIAIINFANFVNGIYMAVPGPTLLFLADRVSTGVGQVSTILSGRSAGNLLGAFAATVISKRRRKNWDATMRLGVSFILFGVTTLAIPLVTTLWALIVVLSVGGFLFGFTNTGFLAVQLDIWGEKKSRPLMQLFQAVYSIGATVAPLIASPFLEMSAGSQFKELNIPSCLPSYSSIGSPIEANLSKPSQDLAASDEINPVTWVYVLIGVLHLLVAATMMIMSLCGVEEQSRRGQEVISEARREEPMARVAPVLLCVIAFYAFQVAAINVFASYIFSVSYCSRLEFSIAKATSLNSLYWGVFIVGRVMAFFVAARTRPSTLISSCIVMLVISAVLMSTFGEKSEWIAWAATTLWALAISPLFGSGVSWVSRITNVSGRYAVIFEIGAAIGAVGAYPVAGVLFDLDPYTVIHFLTGLVGCLALTYVGMLLVGRRHTRRRPMELEQK